MPIVLGQEDHIIIREWNDWSPKKNPIARSFFLSTSIPHDGIKGGEKIRKLVS